MPQILPIVCPECGGALQVKRTDEVVQCPYCRVSAFVRRPGMTAPPIPPGYSQPIRYVDVPRQGSSLRTMFGCLVFTVVGTLAIGLLVDRFITKQIENATDLFDRGSRPPRGSKEPSPAPVKAEPRQPKFVDAVEVIERAIIEARKEVADARLMGAQFHDVHEGMVNVNASTVAAVVFEYRKVDTSKPAGTDVVDGQFHVVVSEGEYSVGARHGGGNLSSKLGLSPQATAPPQCRSADAWKKVVDSGVPASAIAKLYFDRNHQNWQAGTDIEWSFRVAGHPEYRREIDATTCALRRS